MDDGELLVVVVRGAGAGAGVGSQAWDKEGLQYFIITYILSIQ